MTGMLTGLRRRIKAASVAMGPRASVSCKHGGPTMRLPLLLLLAAVLATSLVSKPARAAEPPFHELWRAGQAEGFPGWALQGVSVADGRLVLDAGSVVTAREIDGLALPDGPTGAVGLALGPIKATAGQ